MSSAPRQLVWYLMERHRRRHSGSGGGGKWYVLGGFENGAHRIFSWAKCEGRERKESGGLQGLGPDHVEGYSRQ